VSFNYCRYYFLFLLKKVFESAKSHLESNIEIVRNKELSNNAKIDAIISSLLHGLYLRQMQIYLKEEMETIDIYFKCLSLDCLDKHSEKEIFFRLQEIFGPFLR